MVLFWFRLQNKSEIYFRFETANILLIFNQIKTKMVCSRNIFPVLEEHFKNCIRYFFWVWGEIRISLLRTHKV